MARFRSSTSSSEPGPGAAAPAGARGSARAALVRDLLVLVAVLVGVEVYFGSTMRVFERRGTAAPPEAAAGAGGPSNYYYLGLQDPTAFFADLASRAPTGAIVFVGDSQGASARGEGDPYPKLVARRLPPDTAVVSLHLGGSNGYEQGALLLAMLRAGVVPRVVYWAHSVFSQRKNEIRAELVPMYRSLIRADSTLAADVILVGESSGVSGSADHTGRLNALTEWWQGVLDRSAAVRFSRRPIAAKGEILRRSPLGRWLPIGWVHGTSKQIDPPSSVLIASARFVGDVSAELTRRGVRVVNLLSPVNRAVQSHQFSPHAEAVSYPALQAATNRAGGLFLDLRDAVPLMHYGTFEDGTADPFHFDKAGHALVMEALLSAEPPERRGDPHR